MKKFIVALVFFISTSALAQVKCENILFDQHSLESSIDGLARLRLTLDLALADGASSLALTALKHDYSAKEREMIRFIEIHKVMTREQLFEKLHVVAGREEIKEKEKAERAHREVQAKEFEKIIDGRKLVFHSIQPGEVELPNKDGSFTKNQFTSPFKMAATVTTQIVWQKIVEQARITFPKQYGYLSRSPSHKKGDLLPVESITYAEIYVWAKAVDDLAKIKNPVVEEVLPGYIVGSTLRPPTQAEWEFVRRNRGRTKTEYAFGDDVSDLGKYFWYYHNAGEQIHPVAQKLPLVVDDQEFYDLEGNLYQIMSDRAPDGRYPLRGGFVNTFSPTTFELTNLKVGWIETRSSNVGFRLVMVPPGTGSQR